MGGGADAGEEVVGGFEGAGLLAGEFGLGRHEFAVEGFGEGGLGEPVRKRKKRSPWSRRNGKGEGSACGRCGGGVSPRPEDAGRPKKVGFFWLGRLVGITTVGIVGVTLSPYRSSREWPSDACGEA